MPRQVPTLGIERIEQMRDLAAAISLPEGIYSRFVEDDDVERTFLKP